MKQYPLSPLSLPLSSQLSIDCKATWAYVFSISPAMLRWLATHEWPITTRIAVCSANGPAYAALLQAAFLHNITLVLVNHRLSDSDCQNTIDNAQVCACISDRALTLNIPLLNWPIFDSANDSNNSDNSDNSETALDPQYIRNADPEDIALVLYSSGSSAAAKAVRLSRRAILYASSSACDHNQLNHNDHYLCCLPLDHIGGASIIYRSAVAGFAVMLSDSFDPHALNDSIDHNNISAISLVPTMLHRLLKQRDHAWPQSLRFILIGGADLSTADEAACIQFGCTPKRSYGMSEFASQICTYTKASNTLRPLKGYDIQCGDNCRDNNSDDGDKSNHSSGLISIRSPAAFSGYEINGEISYHHHANNFFTSNDLGHINSGGSLSVIGRNDSIIICGGENISLSTCENQLSHCPLIQCVACCGIPDNEWGQICAALIACADSDQQKINNWLTTHNNGLHQTRYIIFTKEIPLLASGKIDRINVFKILHRISSEE